MDIRGLVIALCGIFVMACDKSALPLPRTGPNTNKGMTVVPYPPPAARAEIIPPKPGSRVVWVDGTWNWDRRRWIWQRGRWEAPPTGAYYASAKITRLPDGTIGWTPGGWVLSNGEMASQVNRAD